MAKKLLRWAQVGLLGLSVGACSLFSGEKDVVDVAPLPEFANQLDIQQQWKVQVGDGVGEYYSQLRPAVAYEQVFVAERFGKLSAYQLDGTLRWTQDLSKLESNNRFARNTNNARISGGLSTAYQRVYLGTENADVLAIDAQTGDIVWQAQVAGEVIAAPAVDESKVVVVTANGRLVALDAHSGEQLWLSVLPQPNLMLRSASTPLISSGVAIVGRNDGKIGLYLLDNGQLVFESSLAKASGATEIDRLIDVDATPVLIGSELYAVAYNGNLVSVDLRSGDESWRQALSAFNHVQVSGGDLFLSDMNDHIYAFDRLSGELRWRNEDLAYRLVTAPAVDGEYVLIGDDEGYLYWLDRNSGEFSHKLLIDSDGLYSAPVVTTEHIIVQGRSGKVVVLSRS